MKLITLIMLVLSLSGADLSTGAIYPDTGVIMTVPGDVVEITMQSGNVFAFYNDAGDWTAGDIVSVIFYDNGTEPITDDIIIGPPRYAGYVDDVTTWIKSPGPDPAAGR